MEIWNLRRKKRGDTVKVVLLGPPGAGKGTHATRLSVKLGVDRISSGDLFREHQEKDTSLGQLARSYMQQGALVPDHVTIRMVMDWIDTPGREKGYVLDGFPRTLIQAQSLDRGPDGKSGADKVFYINVKLEELVRRLAGRLICGKCQVPYHKESLPPRRAGVCDFCAGELYQRDDDKPESVGKRIQIYSEETEPLIDHYRRLGKLEEIDGQRSVENVWQTMESILF